MCAAAPRPARTPYQRTHAHETDESLLCLAGVKSLYEKHGVVGGFHALLEQAESAPADDQVQWWLRSQSQYLSDAPVTKLLCTERLDDDWASFTNGVPKLKGLPLPHERTHTQMPELEEPSATALAIVKNRHFFDADRQLWEQHCQSKVCDAARPGEQPWSCGHATESEA